MVSVRVRLSTGSKRRFDPSLKVSEPWAVALKMDLGLHPNGNIKGVVSMKGKFCQSNNEELTKAIDDLCEEEKKETFVSKSTLCMLKIISLQNQMIINLLRERKQ